MWTGGFLTAEARTWIPRRKYLVYQVSERPVSLVSHVHSPDTVASPFSCPRRNTILFRRRISARVQSYRYACAPSARSSLLRTCFCEALYQAPVVLFLYRRISHLEIVFVITVTIITFCKDSTIILTSKQKHRKKSLPTHFRNYRYGWGHKKSGWRVDTPMTM